MIESFPKFMQELMVLNERFWVRAGQNLTLSEFQYLQAIAEEEKREYDIEIGDDHAHGQHLQNIVDRLGYKKASVSVMVSKLEGKKWVKRLPCQMDARAQHIVLTEKGRELLHQGHAVYAEIFEALIGSMLAEDWARFEVFLVAYKGVEK